MPTWFPHLLSWMSHSFSDPFLQQTSLEEVACNKAHKSTSALCQTSPSLSSGWQKEQEVVLDPGKGLGALSRTPPALMSHSTQQSSQQRACLETSKQHLQITTSPHTLHYALSDVGTVVPIQTHTACKPAESHLTTGLLERPLSLKLQLLKLQRACTHSDPLLPLPSGFRTLVLTLRAQCGTGPTPK